MVSLIVIASVSYSEAFDIDDAISNLFDKMESEAAGVARQAHPASKVENIQLTDSRILKKGSKAADVYASYTVHMRGAILGVNTFSVGAEVTGSVKYNDGNWETWIKGSNKTHDHQK